MLFSSDMIVRNKMTNDYVVYATAGVLVAMVEAENTDQAKERVQTMLDDGDIFFDLRYLETFKVSE